MSTALDVRCDFPVLAADRDLAYLDSAATAQTVEAAIVAMDGYYREARGTVHRSVYPLAVEATARYEGARERIAAFVGSTPRETILTKNATEAINLVARTWGEMNVGEGDVVVVTELEHHANFVPWHQLCRARGAHLRSVGIDGEGQLVLEQLDAVLADGHVKLVAVGHVSNVTGTINPVEEIVARAHAAGAAVLIDGTQAVPQMPVDVGAIGADFYAWTGHKAYGPTGIGVLHGQWDVLRAMPPFLGGGHMIHTVSLDEVTFADPPGRFEAGTSAVAEGIGLGAAVDWLRAQGMEHVRAHERDITAYALERLGEVDGVALQGPASADDRGALVSFTVDVAHPHDVAELLARDGVCVRAGHHCAQPLMKALGVPATTRASFAAHSTREEVDRLVAGVHGVRKMFS